MTPGLFKAWPILIVPYSKSNVDIWVSNPALWSVHSNFFCFLRILLSIQEGNVLYCIIRRQNEHSSSRTQQTQTCLIIRIILNGQEQVIFFGTT